MAAVPAAFALLLACGAAVLLPACVPAPKYDRATVMRLTETREAYLKTFVAEVEAGRITSDHDADARTNVLAEQWADEVQAFAGPTFVRVAAVDGLKQLLRYHWQNRDAQMAGSDEIKGIVAQARAGQDINGEIRRIAERRIQGREAPLTGSAREAELRREEAGVARIVEAAHARETQQDRQARVTELVRLSASNLADMPKEIRLAAQANLADARPILAPRRPFRPSETEVREEEVKLREAVLQEQDLRRLVARSVEETARRDQTVRNCDTQAAVAGASVPTPYVRGRNGWLAAGLLGALESTLTEERVRAACLNASGY